jgi:hypothetical protein
MPAATVYGSPKMRGKTIVKTYRDVAIEQMIATVEEAMSQVIDYWGDLPQSMKEAVEQFRAQLGAAIDSVEFVKRALDRQVHGTDQGKALPDVCCAARVAREVEHRPFMFLALVLGVGILIGLAGRHRLET